MICFPNAKINLGLRVLRKRPDGYHDIETVFLPVSLNDILEIVTTDKELGGAVIQLPSANKLSYSSSGNAFIADPSNDLSVKACFEFDRTFGIGSDLELHIHKSIPSGAGLGGGSSDAANALLMLNSITGGRVGMDELMDLASEIGSDCPFFILNKPCYATGRGERLRPLQLSMKGYHLLLVKPDFGVSTALAYGLVKPGEHHDSTSLEEVVLQPVEQWRHTLKNDFEDGVFALYPELAQIKSTLYAMGAHYASMSGSGSTMFAIFDKKPEYGHLFDGLFKFHCELE